MVKRLLLLIIMFITVTGVIDAQVTTAGMNGKVMASGEPVIGATVQAVHQPSGTNYGTITNMDGRFSLQGMRTGGPYKVTVSYVGYQSATFTGIALQLGETYTLNVELKESSELLDEVVVMGNRSKFATEKTGPTTNINSEMLNTLPTINRSLADFTRLSPYSGGGTSFAGRDGRMGSFTIDGANLNNNFGLTSQLPGGGNPISLDAIDEVQVVIAPYDVRQTNFIGGGINAITKSGTNLFRGSAYTYQRNQNMRGNKIDGIGLGKRDKESTSTYGFTFGGPIIKNKLFFFVNGEYTDSPSPITKFRPRGKADDKTFSSRVTEADMNEFASILKDKYGYDAGSYNNFDGGTTNYKALARIDWNINDNHKLSFRYNYTTNQTDNVTNGASTVGSRASSARISKNAMAFNKACFVMENNVSSFTAELNSRFSNAVSNRLLFTYSDMEDVRSTGSSPFPFVDIWDGDSDKPDAYMSAGYELFSWNNKVQNTIFNVQDNATIYSGNHTITFGASYEHQTAINNFMRFGTGYYRYASFDDFKNGTAPVAFGLTYGYNGELSPKAEVAFAQTAAYIQDEWNVSDRFKMTYGLRADLLTYLNDLDRNEGFYDICFNNRHIDTSKWPKTNVLYSPRVGFNWDVLGDDRLTLRGGTGVFTGRIPLVFFTNMPTNAGMLQNTVQITDAATLSKLKGGMITDVNKMVEVLGLPTAPSYNSEADVKGAAIVGVDPDFKLPQVWKTSVAADYRLPISFPMTVSAEFMYNKDINAVCQENLNVIDPSQLSRFNGPDNRYNYVSSKNTAVSDKVTGGAMLLKNTSKGYGTTINFMVTAEPVKRLNLMASYTHTVAREISGNPGSQALSSWQNVPAVNSPNLVGLHDSQYLTPNKVIASLSYSITYARLFATHIGVYYSGYNAGNYSYLFGNDMNQDGQNADLIYIPKSKDELRFIDQDVTVDKQKVHLTAAQQSEAFWNFVNQDPYLKKHKGEYAGAYGAKLPWVNRFDLKIAQDFKLKAGKSMNTLQVSVDILNVGNLLNSSWGVTKGTSPCNGGRLLNYKGVTADNVPQYTMYYNTVANSFPEKTFDYNSNTSNCWQLQIGVRYVFN